MTVFALRIVFSASVITLTTGAALSASSPSAAVQASSASCSVAKLQPAVLYTTSANARHANISRVRYTAAHAMPARTPAVNALATCSQGGKASATMSD